MNEDEIRERLKGIQRALRENRFETKQWLMLGWGYKPRLKGPKNAVAHKRSIQWYRIRANPKLR